MKDIFGGLLYMDRGSQQLRRLSKSWLSLWDLVVVVDCIVNNNLNTTCYFMNKELEQRTSYCQPSCPSIPLCQYL